MWSWFPSITMDSPYGQVHWQAKAGDILGQVWKPALGVTFVANLLQRYVNKD